MNDVTWDQPALNLVCHAKGRACTRCLVWKPTAEFYQRGERLTAICRECISRSNRKPKAEVDCRQCGTPFLSTRRDARYCSQRCGGVARRRAAGVKPFAYSVVDGKKRCNSCRKWLPVEAFSLRRDRNNRPVSYCRDCWSAAARIAVRRRRGLADDAPRMPGNKEHRYPIGSTILHRGYVIEKTDGHHRADKHGWVPQHILVAEEKYGIRITRDFTVHHINGHRSDNRPENLDLRYGNHGKGADVIPALLRLPEMRAVARAVLAQYDD